MMTLCTSLLYVDVSPEVLGGVRFPTLQAQTFSPPDLLFFFGFISERLLTDCCEESRAGAAWWRRDGWGRHQGWFCSPRRSITSSLARARTLHDPPSQPTSHCLPDSSPNSPATATHTSQSVIHTHTHLPPHLSSQETDKILPTSNGRSFRGVSVNIKDVKALKQLSNQSKILRQHLIQGRG